MTPQNPGGFPPLPLVETGWLAENLANPKLRIVDARWRGEASGHQLYLAGHIPGAVHLDWQHDLSEKRGSVRFLILPPDRFARVMKQRGIGDDSHVVAYADLDYSGAARIWWALRYHGHNQVGVLNGGITKWVAEGRPIQVGEPVIDQNIQFTPRVQPNLGASAQEILQTLDDPHSNIRLVDTRPPEQYLGQAVWTPAGSFYLPPGQDEVLVDQRPMRGGHIPGSIPWISSENLDPESWTYIDPARIRDRALAAGIQPDHRVITYCGSGISASLGLFALYLAGYRDLALYDASWEEWGTGANFPIGKSAPPGER